MRLSRRGVKLQGKASVQRSEDVGEYPAIGLLHILLQDARTFLVSGFGVRQMAKYFVHFPGVIG